MKPRDPELYALVKAAVLESVARVREALDNRGFVLNYTEYPNLSWFEKSGLPHLSSRTSTVPDYADAFEFDGSESKRIDFAALESFKKVSMYCEENKESWKYFIMSEAQRPMSPKLARVGIQLMILHAMNRFLHLHGPLELTDERLLPIYVALEEPIFSPTLVGDVLVPILATRFNSETIELAEQVSIRRLSDEEHLARFPLNWSRNSVNLTVLGAATHAYVLHDVELPRTFLMEAGTAAWEAMFPKDEIDLLFHSLRIATGLPVGYAQFVVQPHGWATEFLGALPPLIAGPRFRAFPDRLEDYGWLREPPEVGDEQLEEVRSFLPELRADTGSLRVAIDRYSSSMLRATKEDSIIDCCIALEALLGDKSGAEITHRLALRTVAVMATLPPPLDPILVFRAVKDIYKSRSRVVHGQAVGKALTLGRDGSKLSVTDVARAFTRLVLRALLHDPRLRDPAYIDTELILNRIGSVPDVIREPTTPVPSSP